MPHVQTSMYGIISTYGVILRYPSNKHKFGNGTTLWYRYWANWPQCTVKAVACSCWQRLTLLLLWIFNKQSWQVGLTLTDNVRICFFDCENNHLVSVLLGNILTFCYNVCVDGILVIVCHFVFYARAHRPSTCSAQVNNSYLGSYGLSSIASSCLRG